MQSFSTQDLRSDSIEVWLTKILPSIRSITASACAPRGLSLDDQEHVVSRLLEDAYQLAISRRYPSERAILAAVRKKAGWLAIDQFRREDRRSKRIVATEEEVRVQEIEVTPSEAAAALRSERRRGDIQDLTDQARRHLSPDEQLMFEEIAAGSTAVDVAKLLNITPRAVDQRIHRARKRMKSVLGNDFAAICRPTNYRRRIHPDQVTDTQGARL